MQTTIRRVVHMLSDLNRQQQLTDGYRLDKQRVGGGRKDDVVANWRCADVTG